MDADACRGDRSVGPRHRPPKELRTVEQFPKQAADGWNVFLNIVEMGSISGIDEISTATSTDERHYNLMGQPIDANAPGIHIVGGKKIIVR